MACVVNSDVRYRFVIDNKSLFIIYQIDTIIENSVDVDETPDKESTSYNDIFDTFSMTMSPCRLLQA